MKIALKNKRYCTGPRKQNRIRFAVCGHEESNDYKVISSSVSALFAISLIMGITRKRAYKLKEFDFQNAFLNGSAQQTLNYEKPKYPHGDAACTKNTLRLETFYMVFETQLWPPIFNIIVF